MYLLKPQLFGIYRFNTLKALLSSNKYIPSTCWHSKESCCCCWAQRCKCTIIHLHLDHITFLHFHTHLTNPVRCNQSVACVPNQLLTNLHHFSKVVLQMATETHTCAMCGNLHSIHVYKYYKIVSHSITICESESRVVTKRTCVILFHYQLTTG